MRLKPDEIKKLSLHLGNLILKKPDVTLKSSRQKILDTIELSLTKHFEEERQIDIQTEALYKERADEFGKLDRAKAMGMIRKQISEAKDFILSGAPDGRFSKDKISHISHLVADKLYDDDLLDFKDEDEGPQYVKKVFTEYFGRENEVIEKVRKKILSMSSPPFEGSRDWDVLYKKYFEEEMRRIAHTE